MPEHQASRRTRSRPSLSDWYTRPEDDEAGEDNVSGKETGSTQESSIGFLGTPTGKPFSPLFSPSKRIRPSDDEFQQSNYFIGDQASFESDRASAVSGPRGNADSEIFVRGLCAVYFENHVSPVLRSLQQAQESINSQLSDIRLQLARKAEAQETVSVETVEELVAKEVARRSEASDSAVLRQLQELVAVVERKVDADDVTRLKEEVAALRADNAQAATVAAESSSARPSVPAAAATSDRTEVKKLQVLVAAAGSRFEKQLQELRRQVCDIQSKTGGTAQSNENLWPGRVLGSGPVSDAGSDTGSAAASLTGSLAGSTRSLEGEDGAELKKMRAVVGAAGTVFYKDLRDLRKDVHEVREQMVGLKGVLAAGGVLLKNSDIGMTKSKSLTTLGR